MTGITLDTGVLIALERRGQRVARLFRRALERDLVVTVPADVVAEWWQGRTELREAILQNVDVEPLTEPLAKLAGEALAAARGATLVHAIVMASAARRGDVVYSSDVTDLQKLQRQLPAVRVLRV